MKSFLHFMLAIIFLCLINHQGFSQSEKDAESTPNRPHALLFQIISDFFITGFEGSLISYEKQISKKTAWRIGLSLNGNYTESTLESNSPDTSFSSNAVSRSGQFGLSFSMLHVVNSDSLIQLYFGYGLGTHFSLYTSSVAITSIGPKVLLGVKYCPTDWLSLSAEYGASLFYKYSNEKTVTSDTYIPIEVNRRTFEFQTRGILVGAAIHFN